MPILFVISLVGCSSQENIASSSYAEPPKNNLSTFVIFRSNAVPYKLNARVLLDGKQVAILPDKYVTWVQAPEGSHVLTIKFPALAGVAENVVAGTFKSGDIYYIQYVGGVSSGTPRFFVPKETPEAPLNDGGGLWNGISIVENKSAESFIRNLTYTPSTK